MTIGHKELVRLGEMGAATVYEAHGQKGAIRPWDQAARPDISNCRARRDSEA